MTDYDNIIFELLDSYRPNMRYGLNLCLRACLTRVLTHAQMFSPKIYLAEL